MAEQEGVGAYAEFGKWLRERRQAARLDSQPEAVLRAKAKKLRLITQGKLSHIERGMNGNPEPELLAELAQLYEIDYPEIVSRWIRAKYGVANDAQNDTEIVGQATIDVPGDTDSAPEHLQGTGTDTSVRRDQLSSESGGAHSDVSVPDAMAKALRELRRSADRFDAATNRIDVLADALTANIAELDARLRAIEAHRADRPAVADEPGAGRKPRG